MPQDNINIFENIYDRLTKANLLVLDKEISIFLSDMAQNHAFRNIITECNKNYSFEEDWQKMLFQQQIILPMNKRDRIAFVTGLLYKLDVNEMSSIDMLMNFYPDKQDLQSSYTKFCKYVLIPFKEAFIAMLKGEPVSEESQEKELPVLDKMIEDINEWIKLLIQAIERNIHNYNEKIEREVNFMIKGFCDNLDNANYALTKVIWTGLKNTLIKYNMDYKEIREIEKLFNLYGLNMEI